MVRGHTSRPRADAGPLAPDVEVEFAPEFEALGLGGTFRGHDGQRKVFQAYGEAWEGSEGVPVAVLDLGDRVLVLSYLRLPGSVSGVELEPEFAEMMARAGLVVRDQYFFGWDKGLQAAGLDPNDVTLPSRGQVEQATRSTG